MPGLLNNLPTRLLVFTLVFAVASLFFVPSYTPFSVIEAQAQVKKTKKRQNIFNLLFGKRGSLNSRNNRNKAKRIKINKKRFNRRPARPSIPKIIAVEKNENASKILIAGDFMAGSLAKGLAQAYADNPDVIIINLSNGLSGFVRDDVKNWPAQIASHIKELKPAAVVFLAGMNDRQQMRLKSGRVAKMSEPWLAAYNNRTQTLAKSVQDEKIPLVWVGLPPVKSGKMSRDYLVFNEIYRTQVEGVSGTYVDVWDAFTNAEGQFVSAGPDINGQIKRLRASDGINMNKTGRRKLAFYAKRAIMKLTGIGTETLLVSLPGIEDRRSVTPQYNPAKTGRTIVYSLSSPNLDGGGTLAGKKPVSEEKGAKKSVSYELVNSGKLPKTHKGRIDHYGVVANEAPPRIVAPNNKDKIEEAKAKPLTEKLTQ